MLSICIFSLLLTTQVLCESARFARVSGSRVVVDFDFKGVDRRSTQKNRAPITFSNVGAQEKTLFHDHTTVRLLIFEKSLKCEKNANNRSTSIGCNL
jgi:hypothetical protein